ncbi:PAS domain S-box protein [Thiomicrorhabdus indica]|uniref:sensor domain-containing diguanylate cyclase n=1 Tax=Thiomicrorhabdus indica TaxID=2267253 RepID=UPI00102DFE65|nr:PAS domain S-box protein [Thiomicrorhabdus indica]
MPLLNDLLTAENLIDAMTEAGYAISIADATQVDMPLIYVNQVFCEITGYALDEVRGKNCRFLHGMDTESSAVEKMRNAIQNKQSCQVTLTNYTKNSQAYKVQLSLTPVFDEKDRLRLYVGFHQDVTQLEQLEYSLKSKKKELEIISSSINDGLLVKNSKGEVLEANPASQEILGLSLSELVDKPLLDPSWKTIHRDGSDYPSEEHPSTKVLKTGQPVYKQEMGVYKPDNSISWIQINSLPLKNEGLQSAAVISTFTDVTSLRNTENKLQKTNRLLQEKSDKLNTLSRSFEQAQKIASVGHWILEWPSKKLIWSDEVFRILGELPQSFQITYKTFLSFVPLDERQALMDEFSQSIQERREYTFKHRILRKNGETRFMLERGFHDFDEKGQIKRSVGTINDVTEQHKKDFQIASYVELINRQLIMSRTDLTGKIVEVSDFFCEISGYRREELIGQCHNIVRHPEMTTEVFSDLWTIIKRTETWEGELKNLRKDGSYYWIETRISPEYDHLGNHIGYVSISIDITAQKSLEEIAIRDEMTGLYNRRFYNQNIHQEIRRAKRQGLWLCFMMLDADNFKKYNDTYGHQAGDEVLKTLAMVLKKVFRRAGDYCFRLGGEEFAVLFEVEHQKDGEIMAEEVCKAIYDQAIEHSGNAPWMRLTVSIGVMLMDPLNNYVEEEIYKYADEALYRAKDAGRNRVMMVEEHLPELF